MTRTKIQSALLIVAPLVLTSLLQAQAGKPAQSNAPATKPTASLPSPGNQQDLAAQDLRAIRKPALPEFHPQEPKRIQLANGMVIFLQEDHELPLIEGTAYIKGGSESEPADRVGLASIYGSAWRTGGTKSKTGDQFDDELEARAATIESSGGLTFTSLNLSCLKGDFDFVLGDFTDLLRNPEFREEKIDIAKNEVKTGIARRNDNLGQIAFREAAKIGYGAKSPFARVPEYATVAAVNRQDLLDWHKQYVQPNNIILGITGDFDSAAMEQKLRSAFESWPQGPAALTPSIPIPPPNPGIYFIAKDDVNQSEIRMVAPGIRRDDPDFYAVQVMNEIFGGGFASRLFSNLRTKAGLAYAVGGSVSAPFDHRGLTMLTMGTKSGTTAQAVEGLYKEIDDMHSQPVTAAELQRGKDAILNSFIFQFDSKEKVMRERMTYELYGYPADFLERYQKGVEKVTAEDVDRVAQKYLVKDKFAALVVGKSSDFDKQLDTFGKVTPIDITIPQPGAAKATVAAASNPEGKALLAKVIAASGGAEKLNAVKSVRVKANITLKEQGLSLEGEEIDVLPDKVHNKMQTPGGEIVMVTSPTDSYMSMGAMGVRPMPSSQRDESLKSVRRTVWYVSQHAGDPQYVFSAKGTEKVGDVQASVLAVHADGQDWLWYVDPTGRIVRVQYEASGQTGPATRVVDNSDFRAVDGITVPFHEEVSVDGKPALSVTMSSFEINPNVDASLFAKPAAAKPEGAKP